MLAGLLWPSAVVVTDVFAHGVMAWTTGESPEWNDGFVRHDIFHVLDGFEQVESLASSGSFISVLKVSSQVIDSAFSRYKINNTSC